MRSSSKMMPIETGSASTSGVGKSASTTTEETQPDVIAPAAMSSAERGRVLKAIRIRLMVLARSWRASTVRLEHYHRKRRAERLAPGGDARPVPASDRVLL